LFFRCPNCLRDFLGEPSHGVVEHTCRCGTKIWIHPKESPSGTTTDTERKDAGDPGNISTEKVTGQNDEK
jgi:hypothetical protein